MQLLSGVTLTHGQCQDVTVEHDGGIASVARWRPGAVRVDRVQARTVRHTYANRGHWGHGRIATRGRAQVLLVLMVLVIVVVVVIVVD